MSRQVLVVDDDRSAVKYLSALLREHGFEPISAGDGAEGLRMVKQSRPDLIVLDIMMPKKSGLALCTELRRDPAYRDIPILMISGVAGMFAEIERLDVPAERTYDSLREALKKKIRELHEEGLIQPDMFMDKPVDPDAFIAKVRALLEG
jgi:DNA-binding response OmpR family regulator